MAALSQSGLGSKPLSGTEVAQKGTHKNVEKVPAGWLEPWEAEDLAGIESWDDAVALIELRYGALEDVADVLGDGFTLIQNKAKLVDVPMLLLNWRLQKGDFGPFVTVHAFAKNPANDFKPWKVIFNDGSRGIADQLAEFTKTRERSGGLRASHGLRVSEYDFCDDCRKAAVEECGQEGHKTGKASTYYLDTSM